MPASHKLHMKTLSFLTSSEKTSQNRGVFFTQIYNYSYFLCSKENSQIAIITTILPTTYISGHLISLSLNTLRSELLLVLNCCTIVAEVKTTFKHFCVEGFGDSTSNRAKAAIQSSSASLCTLISISMARQIILRAKIRTPNIMVCSLNTFSTSISFLLAETVVSSTSSS